MISLELAIGHQRARLVQILDLFGEDSWRNVYAGELEVRPPGAPTTQRAPTILPVAARPRAAVARTMGERPVLAAQGVRSSAFVVGPELQPTFEPELHVHWHPTAIESKVTDGAGSTEQLAKLHWGEVTSGAAINRDKHVPLSQAWP